MSVEVSEGRRIIKFTGFDDIDDDIELAEEDGTASNMNRRKRGGRKRNRRNKIDRLETGKSENGNDVNQKNNPFKSSKLLQEIHDRERVHGMRRDEARQLLEDKLLFLGDTSLQNVHLRRFCLVVPSEETFQLEDGSKIPSEVITISMDTGKISSILRFFPSKIRSFEMENVENYQNHRMRRVYWNPSVAKDCNLMFRTWSHFLDRCLLSLLLVPLKKHTHLLNFLRKINELRTALNNRTTVSICLSRVICVEDYLGAIQNVMNTQIILDSTPSMDLVPLHYALDYCRYHLCSMDSIIKTMSSFSYSERHFYVTPVYYEYGAFDMSNWACHQEAHINMEPEKYERILHWLSKLSLEGSEDVEENYDISMSYDAENDKMFAGTP
ncbi:hypothetical protein GCK72_009598 [Caenorhabditis remanei]|uniref:Uncharacterized protein n=2 Tax=Caenorhabditis remanei TaxID=31234 RepID=A0A6A5H4E2_CAERE|nr:hypothetical protein GCK72_009598 [Caenorhabditis remanei]KAF1761342.1 hypothetical protein GCK72_009598 [Caenorhabditis remanei]